MKKIFWFLSLLFVITTVNGQVIHHPSRPDARNVFYDNSSSSLVADEVQSAIDEIITAIGLGGFTDNRVLRADGTSAIQDSTITLSDSGVATGYNSITSTTLVSLNHNGRNVTLGDAGQVSILKVFQDGAGNFFQLTNGSWTGQSQMGFSTNIVVNPTFDVRMSSDDGIEWTDDEGEEIGKLIMPTGAIAGNVTWNLPPSGGTLLIGGTGSNAVDTLFTTNKEVNFRSTAVRVYSSATNVLNLDANGTQMTLSVGRVNLSESLVFIFNSSSGGTGELAITSAVAGDVAWSLPNGDGTLAISPNANGSIDLNDVLTIDNTTGGANIIIDSTDAVAFINGSNTMASSSAGVGTITFVTSLTTTTPIVDINASTGLALDGANLNSSWLVNGANEIRFGQTNNRIYRADGISFNIEAGADQDFNIIMATSAGTSNPFTITGQKGGGANTGGALAITAGAGGASGAQGGASSLTGGPGISTSGGGASALIGGPAPGSGKGGPANVTGGTSSTGSSGDVNITTQNSATVTGIISLLGGDSTTGTAASAISIIAGGNTATGGGGPLVFTSGRGGDTSGNSGNITIANGPVTSGTRGDLIFDVHDFFIQTNSSGFVGELIFDNNSANRAYTFPNLSGNIPLLETSNVWTNTNNFIDDVLVRFGDSSDGVDVDFDSASGDLELNRVTGDADIEINMPIQVTRTLDEASQFGPDPIILNLNDGSDKVGIITHVTGAETALHRGLIVWAEADPAATSSAARMVGFNSFAHIALLNSTSYSSTAGNGALSGGRYVARHRGSGTVSLATGISTVLTNGNNVSATGTVTNWKGILIEGQNPGNNSSTGTFMGIAIEDIGTVSHSIGDYIGLHIENMTAATTAADNAAIAIQGTSENGSAIHFNWASGGATEKIYANTTNEITVRGNGTINLNIAGTDEVAITPNTFTFEAGASDPVWSWATSDIMALTAGVLQTDNARNLSVTAVSATDTLDATDHVMTMDATGGVRTVNLPAVSGITGREYYIKKIDASANAVTVDGNAAETIDGAATFVLSAQYDVVHIVAGASEWHILSQ